MDEETVVALEEERPPEDSDRTWHVHPTDGWGWGTSCSECRADPPRYGTPGNPARRPGVNLIDLRRQNIEGTTTASEEREMIGDRWNDEKIGRAR